MNLIVSSGLPNPHHGSELAQILGTKHMHMQSIIGDQEAVYHIGLWQAENALWASESKRVLHWLGSDICQTQKNPRWVKIINKLFHKQLCQSESNQEELKEMGIEAEVIPLPPLRLFSKSLPMPSTIAVSIYSPTTNDDNLYYQTLNMKMASLAPKIDFIFYGNGCVSRDLRIDNVVFLPWVNPVEVLNNSNIVVRMTKHDGFPKTLVEALTAGRFVISNYKLHGAIYCEPDAKKIVEKIIYCCDQKKSDSSSAEYWREKLNHDRFREKIYNVFQGIKN